MLTLVPNPSIGQWIALFKVFTSRSKIHLGTWTEDGSISGLLSKSMWSIALIAHWRSKYEANQSVVLLLPDYFCNSALLPTKLLGHQILFYEVHSNLTVDVAELRNKCKQIRPGLVVVPHYFAKENDQISEIAEITKSNGAWLIEDCAHCLLPEASFGNWGDFVLFSPHKLIPSPSGAILVLRSEGPSRLGNKLQSIVLGPETWEKQISQVAQDAKILFGKKEIYELLWLLKRLAQLIGLWRKPRNQDVDFTGDQDEQVSVLYPPSVGRISQISLNFYTQKAKQRIPPALIVRKVGLASVIQLEARRRRNVVGIWDQLISVLSDGRVLPLITDTTSMTPYLAEYEGSIEDISNLLKKLRLFGLPVMTWPDLPPEIFELDQHGAALQLRSSRLYLPLHRSIKKKEISKVYKKVVRNSQSDPLLTTSFDTTDRKEWEDLLKRANFSNLLQSWSYGEAKRNVEGWSVTRRVFVANGGEVALCQSLHRRLFGLFKVIRISRGPVFLDGADMNERLSVLGKIAEYGRWYQLKLLSIAPETYLRPWSEIPLQPSFRQLSVLGSASIILDLSLDTETRRISLKGKWRNQLVASERNGVHVRLSQDLDDFVKFESQYAALVEEKNFIGLNLALMRSIWLHANETDNAFLFVAEYESIDQAAIFVISHGSTATYLAGWNGAVGRKLNCNNLLLWKASCALADLGLKFFDLGGIDEIETPSISSFKAGMGGETYLTSGEYISF
jgi:hypothetical protein